MRLNNHIALRFLTDDTLAFEIIEKTHFKEVLKILNRRHLENVMNIKIEKLWNLVNKDNQKAYLVTETVHDKLDMLKVKPDNENHYDWTVFSEVPNCKKSFILYPSMGWDGGGCLRILIAGPVIEFCHIHYKFNPGSKDNGTCHWILFFINRLTNEHGEHCEHKDVKDIQEFVYKLLCFIFLSENEYEIINPGASKGNKKTGKFKNDLPIPVTIINSKWNITSIRSEGFGVKGHFALRRCGPGRTSSRMVYIEPYQKHGYIRHAGNQQLIP